MGYSKKLSVLSVILGGALASIFLFYPSRSLAFRPIVFPVVGPTRYSNDFNSLRTGGIHHATDIMADKGQKIIAPVDGTIYYVNVPEASWGYSVGIRDSDGYIYRFIHMNNDHPGTDDGQGGPTNAYGPDMKPGNPVTKGQLLGYVGDSGNAEATLSHLHFEIEAPDGSFVNPYDLLNSAPHYPSDIGYPRLSGELLPYGQFHTGMNIDMGNFEGAATTSELVTVPDSNAPAHVIASRTDGTVLASFFAYDPTYAGGADVAAGDVDGDGIDEIITGASKGSGPHVIVYKLDGTVMASFFAFDPNFKGGIRVAAGDIDGDGKADIIVGPASGAGPNVVAFKLDRTVLASFYAYDPTFIGGIDVAAGDVTGGPEAEIITGAQAPASAHVIVYSRNATVLSSFFAYDPAYKGGVHISAGNVRPGTAKEEILTALSSPPGGPHTRMLDGTGALIYETVFMEGWWAGYHDIGAGYGASRAATGVNRRASVHVGPQ